VHSVTNQVGLSTAPAFWRFYAPVIDQLLAEGIERTAKSKDKRPAQP
jgi:hypothetical protein